MFYIVEQYVRGVDDLWTSVNHIAIVVSDVGTSLAFYTDIVGMKQMHRPNFDRYVNFVSVKKLFGNHAVHLPHNPPQ